MDQTQASAVLAEIQATWPHRKMDDAQMLVWMETLSQVHLEPARAAIRRLRESLDFAPSHKEFLTVAHEERLRLQANRALPAGPRQPCPECGDVTFVELRGGHPPTVRPCSRCLPVEHTRWAEGHFMSGHSCGECADIRSGGVARREALAAVRKRHRVVDLEEAF